MTDLGKWADRWKDSQLAFGSPLPPQGQMALYILDSQEISVKEKKKKPQEIKEIKGSSHNRRLIWGN